jgi:tRNA dimethylallyltransferase
VEHQSAALAGADVERIFVDVPRAELDVRAARRFDAMIAAGAMEEVRPLLDYDPSLPMMKAIGVRELAAHLRGEIGLDEAVAKAKTVTRHYIKRQLTWWRARGGWDRG